MTSSTIGVEEDDQHDASSLNDSLLYESMLLDETADQRNAKVNNRYLNEIESLKARLNEKIAEIEQLKAEKEEIRCQQAAKDEGGSEKVKILTEKLTKAQNQLDVCKKQTVKLRTLVRDMSKTPLYAFANCGNDFGEEDKLLKDSVDRLRKYMIMRPRSTRVRETRESWRRSNMVCNPPLLTSICHDALNDVRLRGGEEGVVDAAASSSICSNRSSFLKSDVPILLDDGRQPPLLLDESMEDLGSGEAAVLDAADEDSIGLLEEGKQVEQVVAGDDNCDATSNSNVEDETAENGESAEEGEAVAAFQPEEEQEEGEVTDDEAEVEEERRRSRQHIEERIQQRQQVIKNELIESRKQLGLSVSETTINRVLDKKYKGADGEEEAENDGASGRTSLIEGSKILSKLNSYKSQLHSTRVNRSERGGQNSGSRGNVKDRLGRRRSPLPTSSPPPSRHHRRPSPPPRDREVPKRRRRGSPPPPDRNRRPPRRDSPPPRSTRGHHRSPLRSHRRSPPPPSSSSNRRR